MKAADEPLWTIDELGARTAAALSVNYEGPPNDRVREVPDRRTIRYYTTLGLIDRPAAMRGRTALYGRRHLMQLVAIKRMQARGLSLAEVQRRLVGLTDSALGRLARLPVEAEGSPPAASDVSTQRSEGFWKVEPSAAPVEEGASETRPAGGSRSGAGRGGALPLQGVAIRPELTLLLAADRPLGEEEVDAIRKAAGPLVRLLETRRLIRPREGGERDDHADTADDR